ncbi:MAG TPA: AAA family ATPase [Clostridiales bacterium]|nr:AAA family ATPase [Clostridiales bacterium]
MDCFKKIIIKEVTMKGFKAFKDSQTFKFNDQVTAIYSDNHTGKTSLLDSIVWAFIGTDKMGETRDTYLMNDECNSMQVRVIFESEQGRHILERKKSGKTLSILLDELPLTQAQMESICYSKHLFLSIVNPEYFVAWASEYKKDAQGLLYSILLDIPQEKIMKRLDSQSKELLAGKNLNDVPLFLRNKRAELSEYEKDILHITGQYDVLTKLMDDASNDLDISSIDNEISKLNRLLNKYNNNADTINNQLENLMKKKANLIEEKALLHKDEAIDKFKNELLIKNNQLETYRKTYADMAKEANKLKPGLKCNTCQQVITEEHVAQIHATTGKKLKDITVEAKELANEIETIKKKLLVSEKENADKIRKLDVEMEYIDIKINAIKNDSLKIKKENTETKDSILAKIIKLQETKSKIKNKAVTAKELERIKTMLQKSEQNKIQTEKIIQAGIEYSYQKSEMLMSGLNDKMRHTKIKLQEVIKSTGEIKECFKLTYNSRNTILISTSEKIKMGAEISKLLRELLGVDYFMILDNAECLTIFKPVASQTIAAMVRENTHLKIDGKELEAA